MSQYIGSIRSLWYTHSLNIVYSFLCMPVLCLRAINMINVIVFKTALCHYELAYSLNAWKKSLTLFFLSLIIPYTCILNCGNFYPNHFSLISLSLLLKSNKKAFFVCFRILILFLEPMPKILLYSFILHFTTSALFYEHSFIFLVFSSSIRKLIYCIVLFKGCQNISMYLTHKWYTMLNFC